MKVHKRIRHNIDKIREQPLEVRRQLLVFFTFIGTFLVILLWVATLKERFKQEVATDTSSGDAVQVIKESVTRVYNDQNNKIIPEQ